jgi:cytochrome c oxidase assembly protein subunit 15
LETPARVAIHYTHRIGAGITFLILGFLAIRYLRRGGPLALAGALLAAALATQVLLGLAIVWFGLPLALATAHNGVAALLLLATVNLNHAAARYRHVQA